MPYKNTEEHKAYQQKWHSENKRPKSNQTGWLKRKEMVANAKNKPCASCNIKYDTCVMDLHHLDPSVKDSQVSKLMKSSSYNKLQEEIDKCVVLCANCHRMLHAGIITLGDEYVERV